MRMPTHKQRRFAEEYTIDCNATQAAIRAGYSRHGAEEIGYQLLQKTPVRELIDELLLDKAERCQVSADWVVKHLREVAERCMQAVEILDSQGKPTGVYKFNSKGACKALELLGKHIGMFRGDGGQPKRHVHFHAHQAGTSDAHQPFMPPIREVIVNRPVPCLPSEMLQQGNETQH